VMQLRHARRMSRLSTGVLIGLLFLIPLLYVIMISLEPPSQFISSPLRPPTSPALSNFSQAWGQGDLGPQLLNTILYSVAAAFISTALSLLIAFPVARSLVRWSSGVYRAFVVGICLPLPIIPLFVEAQKLQLFNSRIGYIILHVEVGLPLGVLLLTAFVSSIPRELDEAAWLDGSSYLRYIVSFVVPLAWPSLVITFLYSMLGVWNDIIGPVVFLASPSLFPVTRGIYNFYGSNESEWTLLAAGIIIVSLPVLILFVASQRQLLRSAIGASS
jgi:raffinose/stachyose/melibiose transport system permease protein